MGERIFNIFFFFESGVSVECGIWFHKKLGPDADLLRFLREQVDTDLLRCRRFPLDAPISQEEFAVIQRMNRSIHLIDTHLEKMNAPRAPLVCVTPVVEGKVTIDITSDEIIKEVCFMDEHGLSFVTGDYLANYSTNEGFRTRDLIEDEFLSAISVLIDGRKHVSALKLLMSAIDTFAYLEYGDEAGNFQMWVDRFCDLSDVKVTPEELWEFRNSILHMTNLTSRKVVKGEVRSLVPTFPISHGRHVATSVIDPSTQQYLNVQNLWRSVLQGVDQWISLLYSEQRILKFFERYEGVVADARIHLSNVRIPGE